MNQRMVIMNVKNLNRWQKHKDKLGPSIERRDQEDRRRCYRPKEGQLIYFDRSRQPDRRINNLNVEWLIIQDIEITPVFS